MRKDTLPDELKRELKAFAQQTYKMEKTAKAADDSAQRP